MSLDNLARIGQPEAIAPDAGQIARLLAAARRAITDARTPGLSAETRFDVAYRAIMQASNAALQACGYRTLTSKPGHHQTMLQTLPLTVGLDASVMVQLDALRKQRNGIDYSGDIVRDSMADEAIRHADELIGMVAGRFSV